MTRDRQNDGRTRKQFAEYVGRRQRMQLECIHHEYHIYWDAYCWRIHWQQPRFRRLLEGQHEDISVVSLPKSGARRLSGFVDHNSDYPAIFLRYLHQLVA